MSKKYFPSLLVVLITIVYSIYFYCSCIIIPYQTKDDKRIVFTQYIYHLAEKEEKTPVNTQAITDWDSANTQYVIGELDAVAERLQIRPDRPNPHVSTEGNIPIAPHEVPEEQPVADSGRQGHSRVMLSRNRAIKALSALSFKDKLWLVKLLGRCSMEELIRIKDMLQDGVTYEENLSMYKMLGQKVTDDEQKKLDTLIEAYTQ